MDGECAICNTKTPQKCSKCHKVYYCSRDHQKEHWKKHKSNCKPVSVKDDKTLGRHLVATKDIKEGEIIFKEKPLIIGPPQVTSPVCLGCYKTVDESNSIPCERCGWPVCDSKCQASPNHKPECDFTVARGEKVKIQTFDVAHPNYQCIIVLRCLSMKKNNPQVWNTLLKLESHCKERKESYKWENDRVQIAQFIQKFFKLEKEYSEDEIMKICGVVQVNGHEVPFTEPPFVAVFDTTSMIEHNCQSNCYKSFTDRGEVLIAAATDISAGQNLSICYTDPLWGTLSRRHHLAETKFFFCSCERCKDVTELGTMFSALKCQKSGCPGYVLPKTFIDDKNSKAENMDDPANDWICNTCGGALKSSAAHRLMEHVGVDLEAMEKGNCDNCTRFLTHYGKYLHPSHFYLMDVSIALAQLIGQDNATGLQDVSDEQLKMKVDLCQQVADFFEKLVPAEVRPRGMVLFELHAAVAETGRRRAEQLGEGPGVLIECLLESKKHLEKAIKLLQHEPKEMPEGKIALQAVKNLSDLEVLLQKLYSSYDCPL